MKTLAQKLAFIKSRIRSVDNVEAINADLETFQSLGGIGAFNGVKEDSFIGQMSDAPHIVQLFECRQADCGHIGPFCDFDNGADLCNKCAQTPEIQELMAESIAQDEALEQAYQAEMRAGTHWSQESDSNWQADEYQGFIRGQFSDEEWAEMGLKD